MATQSQIIANQANAKHSTGPVTAEGKARVAQNATRHGLTAKNLVVRDDEREEFEAFHADLLAEIDPTGAVEMITFNDLLHAAWNLQRFRRLEAETSLGTIDDLTDPQTAAAVDRLARYQARAQRAYYRALQEVKRLQTNRVLGYMKTDETTRPHIPAMADIAILAKQSQSEATPGQRKSDLERRFAEMDRQIDEQIAESRRRRAEEATS